MKKYLIVFFSLVLSAPVYAGDNHQNKANKSLDNLIAVCQQLASNPQIKDFSSEIVCRGHKTFWEKVDVVDSPLDNHMITRSEIVMKGDRYRVDEYASTFSMDSDVAVCNVYAEKRVEYVPVTVRLATCQGLIDLKEKGRGEFCAEQLRGSSLLFEESSFTGRKRDTCY